MALTKLTSNLIEGGTGTDWVTAIQTSNFTAEAGKGYFVNTTSQVLYVNLPVGVVGMEITIQDYAGTFATNKVILNANGSEKIQGSAYEGRINTNNATAVLIYQDATKGWTSQDVELDVNTVSWATPTGQSLTYSTPSPQSSIGATGVTFPTTTFTATKAGEAISGTATIAGLPSGITAAQTITGSGAGNTLTVTLTGTFPSTSSLNTNLTLSGLTVVAPPFSVSYLVVAGGGGGGHGDAGAGGAGGLRTSYTNSSTLNGHNETSLSITPGTNYTVTVGAGGTASTSGTSNASNGGNSVFSTITSTGGGYGAERSAENANNSAQTGGCGGGGASVSNNNRLGAAAVTSPVTQGYAGGNGVDLGVYQAGGGGGTNGVGVSASGQGGPGLEVNIIGGTGNYYGGGGGGGSDSGSTSNGGTGGGGNGGRLSVNATSGSSNTGGGGGGGGGGSATGGDGGSGIVIVRYPNAYTISGLSGTTTTVGTDKVTTFTNAGTGNIQFN